MNEENTLDRKDSWSPSDDLILAQTVLHHIKSGSTQLSAFEEVSGRLNRTSAACGFRWNATVRKRYDDSIRLAKEERRHNSATKANVASVPVRSVSAPYSPATEQLPINAIIETIRQLQQAVIDRDNRIIELEQEVAKLRNTDISLTEDYKTLIKIMNKARDIGAIS